MSESSALPYFMPAEVVVHNKPDDCWVTCLGVVYDLTDYLRRAADSPMHKYIVAYAGTDVTQWFNAPRAGQCYRKLKLKRYVDPVSGERKILLPYGTPVPEGVYSTFQTLENQCCPCSCADPRAEPADCEAELTGKCWSELECIFNGTAYRKGLLTKKARPCRITNVLAGVRSVIWVCEEDSIERIQERALLFNRHGASYTWKFEGKPLKPGLTLTENGIPDERDRYLACGLPDDGTTYIPNLLVYYNDDLTEL